MPKFLALVLALLATVAVAANKMDRETIELVLASVSPSCKEEMELALSSPSDITASCKKEIQGALERRTGTGKGGGGAGGSRGAGATVTVVESGPSIFDDPVVVAVCFMLAATAGAVVWMRHGGKKKKKGLGRKFR